MTVSTENIASTLTAYLDGRRTDQSPARTLMTPDGSAIIATLSYGSDGRELVLDGDDTGTDDNGVHAAADGMASWVDSILAGDAVSDEYTVSSAWRIIARADEKVNAPGDFSSPNGDPWLRVDLSTQTVSAYRGSTLVRTMNAATGARTADKHTDNGVFYVNIKNTVQTMHGYNPDGSLEYETPNVQWISYFNGGEGFHAAPWNTWNIARGVPSSHGCVNMSISNAKWVYDFAPLGTKVEVIGSTPGGAVR